MKNFKTQLDKLYTFYKEEMECPPETKMEFLGAHIFDFTTYDGEVDKLFAERMIEVIECILNRTTFDYQNESEEKYINYLLMVNMPFLKEKLDWGCSIRGAWFDYGEFAIDDIIIEKNELSQFLQQLVEWVRD